MSRPTRSDAAEGGPAGADFDAITEADVHAAYRIALGRPAEGGEAQIKNHLAAAKDLAGLRRRFLSSPEFYRNNARSLATAVTDRAYNNIALGIESETNSANLAKLFAHVEQVWSLLGVVEPHYSVFSAQQFKPSALASNRATFYESGRKEAERLLARLDKLGCAPRADSHVLEFGCGVGRVTRHLASRFRKVTAFDVSQPHLDLARTYLNEQHVDNVDLVRIESLADAVFPKHDFFYSRIVFQHNPPPVTKYLLGRLLAGLNPSGLAVFQVLTAIEGYRFDVASYLAGMDRLQNQELHVLPQKDVFEVLGRCDVLPVDVSRDISVAGLEKVSTMFVAKARARK